MNKTLLLISLFCFGFLPGHAADEGVIVRLAKVFPDANSRGKVVGQISAGSTVSVFSRKGGWKEIFSDKQNITGWVRSYQVREGLKKPEIKQESESDSRGFLAGLASFSRKASGFFGGANNSSGGSTRTATIGVRGLSEEEIKAAKPDLAELLKLQGFGSGQSRMKSFVRTGKLAALKVKHLKKKK